jgi:RHS repeat-associated protein
MSTEDTYLYDGEGWVCAVKSEPVAGTYTMTQYIYDANGVRVAKGTITNWAAGCNIATNGFTPTNSYVLGPSNEQLTETDGNGNWLHSNVYAAGILVATYDMAPTGNPALHFQLEDWLGSRRVQTDISGNTEETCFSLPFGDSLGCTPTSDPTADDATEHHFTGKERDQESGNDYFGAGYYASTMGRFLSPDWSAKIEPVPYAKLDNPQSLNLYAYVGNNPLSRFDPDGHWVCNGNHDQCAAKQTGLNLAQASQKQLAASDNAADRKEAGAIQKVLDFYGPMSSKAGDKGDNGVNVSFASLGKGVAGNAVVGQDGHTVNITFDLNKINSAVGSSIGGQYMSLGLRAGISIHEGTHGVDERHWGHLPSSDRQEDWTEHNAYRNESYTYQGLNFQGTPLWYPGISDDARGAAINAAAQASDAASTSPQ